MTIQAIRPDFLMIRRKDAGEATNTQAKVQAAEAAGTQAEPDKIHEKPADTKDVR